MHAMIEWGYQTMSLHGNGMRTGELNTSVHYPARVEMRMGFFYRYPIYYLTNFNVLLSQMK